MIVFLMVFSTLLTACSTGSNENVTTGSSAIETETDSDGEESSTGSSDGETTEKNIGETTEEITEETTIEITDVMIGETLEAEYAADFTVAKVFSDDMVVQRNEHIRVWGFAPESENGKKVSGEFKGMFAEALIENGEWCLTFGARLDADTSGAEMKIYTDKKTISFKDVLVGDVYLILGQSNVFYSVDAFVQDLVAADQDLAHHGGGKDNIDPNASIRLNHLNGSGGAYSKKGTDYVYADLENTSFWRKPDAESAGAFSALGYYFAAQMTEKASDVPVGMMEVAVGGAPLVSFLPNEIADEFGGDYKDIDNGIYYSTLSYEHMGRYLYNCYLAPVSKYAVAGIIWYQGESNNALQDAMDYTATFTALMNHMRSTHNVINKDFPVFITELPPIYDKPEGYDGIWHYMDTGVIRAYIGSIPTQLKNSYVSVSNDLWSDKTFNNNLHPYCKYAQAGRLAALADCVVNGNGKLDNATGPIMSGVAISQDGKTVTVTFKNVGEGLTTLDGGVDVKGIVGLADGTMGHVPVTPVRVTIADKNHVTAVFDTAVKAVAYNYYSSDLYGETLNLCNSFGCPASAFITPYKDADLTGYKESDLISYSNSHLGYVFHWIDYIKANGSSVATGVISDGISVKADIGTNDLEVAGWVGFGHSILMFGYSIDGSDIVYRSFPITPLQDVINAGGEHARRFNIHMDVSKLSLGEHTVTISAFVNTNGGVAVRLLTFKLNVVEKEKAPEHIDLPAYNKPEYKFVKLWYDYLKADSTVLYQFFVETADKTKVSLPKDTDEISLIGWIGFEYQIEKLGYSIDGGDPIMNVDPIDPESDVINLAGQYSKRFNLAADISKLDEGVHTFDFLLTLNKDGESVTVRLYSFTLEITAP